MLFSAPIPPGTGPFLTRRQTASTQRTQLLDLAIGDRLYWLSTGAYTTSYSAVEFNGFPPLKSFYV